MKPLEIEMKKGIPFVSLNAETETGSIGGDCFDSLIVDVFHRIQHWLRDYATLNKPFSLVVSVEYYNTSASKCFADLFDLIEKINCIAHENWEVTIVTSQNDDEAAESWQEMLPEFPTANFHII